MMTLISSSVTSGSSDGRMRNARRTTLADVFKMVTMGAPTRESAIIGLASALANRSGLCSAICFGTSSPMMSVT